MAVSHPIIFDASMLLCAGASLYDAIEGVKTGEVFVWRGLHAKRTDDPVFFWYGILQAAITAIAFVLAMVVAQL
jgi:hypothetical protein